MSTVWPRALRAASAILIAMTCVVLDLAGIGSQAQAVTADQWRAGNIISNADFFNGAAMSAPQVAAFLNDKGANCVNSSVPCIKNYTTSTPSTPAESNLCDAMPATSSSSAAQIIDNVGRACGISQKVILVMIAKESGLITTTSPTPSMYQTTTGFACPDTAPCDTAYYGFFNQVYRMARQFKRYAANPTQFGYIAGRYNQILYHPNAACGSSTVYIENQATANLYIYTPYQPNGAALANLYGSGDSCSAYGNRNFWRFYSDWFGAPPAQPAIDPQGALDSATPGADGAVRVQGWGYDGSQPISPVTVRFTADGNPIGSVVANAPKPELAYYGIPGNHGYDITFAVPVHGAVTICATAVNIDGGSDVQVGCRQVTVTHPSIDPIGDLRTATSANGSIAVTGWAADGSDWWQTVTVVFTVNDQLVGYTAANQPFADLAYYGIPGDHGFAAQVPPLVNGDNLVCAYASNILGGSTTSIGCRKVSADVPGSPTGYLENVTQDNAGTVILSGYAFDQSHLYDTVQMVFTMDGVQVGGIPASEPRPELAWYGVPGNHGFRGAVTPTRSGWVTYCATAKNVGPGADKSLGCKTVGLVLPGSPIGAIETVARVGSLATVKGWAWDMSAPLDPITAMVTVNGAITGFTLANQPKPVLAYYGIPGNHGYSIQTAAKAGDSVCVFAFNVGPGENRLLGCEIA